MEYFKKNLKQNFLLFSFNLLYKYQFGFCEKHSTNMDLIVFTGKILKALDEGKIVLGVFLE